MGLHNFSKKLVTVDVFNGGEDYLKAMTVDKISVLRM